MVSIMVNPAAAFGNIYFGHLGALKMAISMSYHDGGVGTG